MRIAAGAIVAQKYRLEAQLAQGGMGHVWSARHVALGSLVAIKFVDPKLAASPAFVARFEREARAAATIQSPHVVSVQDFGVEGDTPYLVMELLRGEDLRTRLRRVGRLSLREAAGLLLQIGKALRRAHEAGIVHRDIKPGNLFLARMDDEDVLKVLDFGIAKHPDEDVDDCTRTGEIVGSPHYVSPEQGRGDKDIDHRTDVWSVGVIAYRMVTGQLPFPGQGLGNVLSKVLVEPPPPVRSFVPDLPESLDAFFVLALAKNREDRFQSVRELVDTFVSIVRSARAAEEESIPPPSWSAISSPSVPPPERPPLPRPGPEPTSLVKASAEPEAASAPEALSEPPESTASRLDSLTPATGPGHVPVSRAVRFRWAVVAVVAAMLVGGMALILSQGDSPPSPSTAASPPWPPGPSAPPLPAEPERRPAEPPTSAPPHAVLPTATMTATPTSPSSSAAPPLRSAITPATAAPGPVAPAPPGKRRWGF